MAAPTMQSSISVGARTYRLMSLTKAVGTDLVRLPWVHRILLENCLRNAGDDAAAASIQAFTDWLSTGTSTAEIAFLPGRILMHDTTCVPALVDIAAMRDAVAARGGDPTKLSPVLPVDVSVDHSLAVDFYGSPDSFQRNMARELERNGERYRLMKWASAALKGVRVHPPGTGIMHTMNLEQLSTIVATTEQDGHAWAMPDTLIGTDSHTPMVNGIGVLAWGVGGLEAETVMFGLPMMLRLPDVIGVKLTGALRDGVMGTDVALTVTERLRKRGVSGEFVEFFGPGVSALSAGERAVIANMAPEYGASSGYFAIDENTLSYLAATGRNAQQIELVRAYAQAQQLWFDPTAEPRYSDVIDIDLGDIGMSVAGPRRPQDRIPASATAKALASEMASGTPAIAGEVPNAAVAIAAITSCTNTSDPRLLIAAGLLAHKARMHGLKPPRWVKTSFAPGSPAASALLSRAGLLEDLSSIGFDVVGHGCTTCIGNAGPLAPGVSDAIKRGVTPVAILSGNRNFPGRVHAEVDAAFLASPPLVIAFALAGRADLDITTAVLGKGAKGAPVRLADIWPNGAEIDAALAAALDPDDIARCFAEAGASPSWRALEAPDTPLFPWDPASTYLRPPPFASPAVGTRLGNYTAYPLLVVGDDITTDHISPAGQIPHASAAGTWCTERGDDPADLNVYAARRGNWEVMLRGLFTNRTVRNAIAPNAPPGSTLHAPSGETMQLCDAAERYTSEGHATVIIAGERYGTGSSRDWAAKGVALLGVRAVLATSFERIHRQNLIGMGVLPLRFPADRDASTLHLEVGDRVEVQAALESLAPRGKIRVTIHRRSGTQEILEAIAAVETALEIDVLKNGGALPTILNSVN